MWTTKQPKGIQQNETTYLQTPSIEYYEYYSTHVKVGGGTTVQAIKTIRGGWPCGSVAI